MQSQPQQNANQVLPELPLNVIRKIANSAAKNTQNKVILKTTSKDFDKRYTLDTDEKFIRAVRQSVKIKEHWHFDGKYGTLNSLHATTNINNIAMLDNSAYASANKRPSSIRDIRMKPWRYVSFTFADVHPRGSDVYYHGGVKIDREERRIVETFVRVTSKPFKNEEPFVAPTFDMSSSYQFNQHFITTGRNGGVPLIFLSKLCEMAEQLIDSGKIVDWGMTEGFKLAPNTTQNFIAQMKMVPEQIRLEHNAQNVDAQNVDAQNAQDALPNGGNGLKTYAYKGKAYVVKTGGRGGKYIVVKTKKIYVS